MDRSANSNLISRVALIGIAVACAASLMLSQGTFSSIEAQSRRPQSQRVSKPAERTNKTSRNYSVFKHESHRRNLQCKSCHIIESVTEPDRIAAATKPGATGGYPYHDSCFRCHGQQVYRGDRPVLCAICHTRSSPRLTTRDIHAQFPRRSEITFRQLRAFFPHNLHRQSIIVPSNVSLHTQPGAIVPVSLNSAAPISSILKRVTCADCHVNDTRLPVAVSAGEQSFAPSAGTFKTLPAAPTAHASCFGCHWDTDEPKKDNCQGCHLFNDELANKKWRVSFNSRWFKEWPTNWPQRLSLKFRHENADHKAESCTVCHSAVMQLPTSGLPDVPIGTCVQCHLKVTSRTSISKEMYQEDEDTANGLNNNPYSTGGSHTCTGCHTSQIGSVPPPCSHFLLFGDRYFNTEDYPKSAKEIGGRCKQ